MRKIMSLFLVSIFICSYAILSSAEYVSSYDGDECTREYKYEDDGFFSVLILQDGDLDSEYFCQTLRELVKDQIGEGETIKEISLSTDHTLHIVIDWPADFLEENFLSNADLAEARFSSITDKILAYQELDDYWDKIVFTYPDGEIEIGEESIIESEYGRYFDALLLDEIFLGI